MQCVAVIIQLVSRDHACRFESETEMVKRLGLCWSVKFAVFFMESALTSHGSSKSNKRLSDGREISDYTFRCEIKREEQKATLLVLYITKYVDLHMFVFMHKL